MSKFISFLTFALFFISLLSGLIVVFAYHPSQAFDSVQKINFLIPFGLFFRQLHYFSSEAFLIFLLLHVAIELLKKEIKISQASWNYSILALIIVVSLMFSGFVLKADLSANGAAQVAFKLLKETPILKIILPLIEDNTQFYFKFFIWHILFLPIILTYSIYKHIDTLHVKSSYLIIALGLSLLLPFILQMPPDIVPGEKLQFLSSPWFFLGAENLLLKSFSPIIVNIILSIPIFLLAIYFFTCRKNLIKNLLLFWLISYFFISVFVK